MEQPSFSRPEPGWLRVCIYILCLLVPYQDHGGRSWGQVSPHVPIRRLLAHQAVECFLLKPRDGGGW